MAKLLMPMATAIWLVDNTKLTFQQIAKLCNLHELEVQGIADGTVASHMTGIDPTLRGQLTKEEIVRGEKDPSVDLQLVADKIDTAIRSKGPRYTPVSKRQDKPAAISWLLRHHAELSDNQICKLIGTTKPTINAIRSKSHWNISNIQPQDPVSLGLCRQQELDALVQKMVNKKSKASVGDHENQKI